MGTLPLATSSREHLPGFDCAGVLRDPACTIKGHVALLQARATNVGSCVKAAQMSLSFAVDFRVGLFTHKLLHHNDYGEHTLEPYIMWSIQ